MDEAFSGPLNYGSAGLGTGGHLAGELYKQMTGVNAQHIPYKGTGPALIDLIGGRYEFNFSGLQGALVQVRSGKLRALAVTTPRRLASLPELPAVAEALPGFEVVGWYGVIGPAAMPPNIVARLHAELVKALEAPDIRSRIVDDGSEPVGSSPAQFRDFMSADLDKWARFVKRAESRVSAGRLFAHGRLTVAATPRHEVERHIRSSFPCARAGAAEPGAEERRWCTRNVMPSSVARRCAIKP